MQKFITQTSSSRRLFNRTVFTSLRNQQQQHRFYSSNAITKQELKDLIEKRDSDYLLIDVRNTEELEGNMPLIPTAVNIPLPDFGSALMMADSKRFESMYGIKKPSHNDKIICYCRSGRRSQSACEILEQLQFDNVYNYEGSALDWYNQK
jgi:rhodanese-related sulfurtransferase